MHQGKATDSVLQETLLMLHAQGYLRTGQILQKKEKLETALGIYEYGAKNVPVTDPNYPVRVSNSYLTPDCKDISLTRISQLLKSMRDKLERRLNPPKSLDPLTVLPVEIAEMILTYLTFKNIVYVRFVSISITDHTHNISQKLPPRLRQLE